MAKLHSLENTELSEYCLNILEKHEIRLVKDFIVEKPEKLMKILNLNYEQVIKIRKELVRLYGPTKSTLLQRDVEESLQFKVYGSQIPGLDHIMGEQEMLNNLSFWEICGQAGIGKTQLSLTLMINFILHEKREALYIDTKLDFCAGRIKSMLKAREVNADAIAGIMSLIKVERALSAQAVVEMLDKLYEQLQQCNPDVIGIKFIVIDSLPAVWFLLKADANRLPGKWLLSRLSQVINRLVQDFFITVICVNLSLLPAQEENQTKSSSLNLQNDNDISDLIEADDMDLETKTPCLQYRPVLGHFWLSKPRIRLSLELPSLPDNIQDSSLRLLRVIKSSYSPSNVSCLVKLQDTGVVDAGDIEGVSVLRPAL